MTKQEADDLKNTISNSYFFRSDYPLHVLISRDEWDDRIRYKKYIYEIIDELIISNSTLDNLKQAKELLKLVGNNGKDMLLEDFTDDQYCPYDNIFLAIKHIDRTIEIFMNESEENGN